MTMFSVSWQEYNERANNICMRQLQVCVQIQYGEDF